MKHTVQIILIILGVIFLIFGLSNRLVEPLSFYFSMIIVIVIGIIVIIITPTTTSSSSDSPKSESPDSDRPTLLMNVNVALYAIIAGFAITNSMRFIFDEVKKELPQTVNHSSTSYSVIFEAMYHSQYEIVISAIFLLTAIPFYHGAMVFLSDKSRTIEKENSKSLTIHFLVLFTQSIIFLAVSYTLVSIKLVVALFVGLMIIDSIWIIWGQTTKSKPPLGWLGLNLIFTSFLFISIYQLYIEPEIMLLIFCIIRTGLDYFIFKHMYSK